MRRLPRSRGVLLTIRTYFDPVTEIAEEPGVPGRQASAVRSWGEDVGGYNGKEKYGDMLSRYLDEKHTERVALGLTPESEEVESKYPW